MSAAMLPPGSVWLPAPYPVPGAVPTLGEVLIDIRDLWRVYHLGTVEVQALRGVSLQVRQGEFVAIVGPSGSGKSTLMNVIGCLDRPSSGSYVLAGTPVDGLSDDELARLRSREIGFVFQSYNLLARTSAIDNVATPLLYQGVGRRERMERSKAALEMLGLGDRLDHMPSELSGGQQQRVAIARALVTNPSIILADEPTGNLDSASGVEVMARFHALHREGRTIVLITHDHEVAAQTPRQIHVRDGQLT
jgi:putative ABC transport system ATP-binding protein